MAEKKALIFDTNFIIEHSKDLNTVVEKLSKTYEVFVTQLSIDERISQQYLDLKAKYDNAKKIANEIKSFAKLEFIKDFEDAYSATKTWVQNNYTQLFPNKIIPFSNFGCTSICRNIVSNKYLISSDICDLIIFGKKDKRELSVDLVFSKIK